MNTESLKNSIREHWLIYIVFLAHIPFLLYFMCLTFNINDHKATIAQVVTKQEPDIIEKQLVYSYINIEGDTKQIPVFNTKSEDLSIGDDIYYYSHYASKDPDYIQKQFEEEKVFKIFMTLLVASLIAMAYRCYR